MHDAERYGRPIGSTTGRKAIRRSWWPKALRATSIRTCLSRSLIKAMDRDPAAASAEYMAQFRTDVEVFITREAVEDCVKSRSARATTRASTQLCCLCRSFWRLSRCHDVGDRSQGRQDANPRCDLVSASRHSRPEAVTEEYAKPVRSYRCTKVYGDRYGGEWPREQFRKQA